jgi:2-hydroxychromene-2-carboxylate isomerase
MSANIDYFFAPGSPWAFLGLDPLLDLANRHGATVTPYPITIIAENGAISSKNRPEPRRKYWLTDLKRWSVARDRALIVDGRPALSDPTPIAWTIIAAQLDGKDWAKVTGILQSAFWQKAEDVGLPDVRRGLLDAAGFDGKQLLARENDADVKQRWDANLALATSAGIFGSPTFVIDGQPYWGQDSLPFVERHLQGEPLLSE